MLRSLRYGSSPCDQVEQGEKEKRNQRKCLCTAIDFSDSLNYTLKVISTNEG